MVLASILLLVPSAIKAMSDTRQQVVASREKQLAKRGQSTLHDAREKLREALRQLQSSIVIVIDDIDRLPPDQMAMIFQLVKANGDFPRISYILGLQRDTVERGLQDSRKVNGSEYLEKIIQLAFEVPQVDRALIRQELHGEIRTTLDRSGLAGEFEWERWDVLYEVSLEVFFGTLRHVSRYLDALRFQCAVLSVHGTIEVDITDLAALEALRVFVPEVHQDIGRNKNFFAGAELHSSKSSPKQDEVDEKIKHLPPVRRAAVLQLLQRTFPRIQGTYGEVDPLLLFDTVSYPRRRACNPEVFDRYFLLAVPVGDIPHAEVMRVVEGLFDPHRFRDALVRHEEDGTLDMVISRVFSCVDWRANHDDLHPVVALLDIGDRLPLTTQNQKRSTLIKIRTLLYDWLRNAGDAWENLLMLGIERSHGVVLPTYLTASAIDIATHRWEERAHRLGQTLEPEELRRKVLGGDLGLCATTCAQRLQHAAITGYMDGRLDAFELLYAWRQWGDPAEVQWWVSDYTVARENFLRLLWSFWYVPERHPTLEGWEVVPQLEELFPPDTIRKRLSLLSVEELPDRYQRMVGELIEAWDRATQEGLVR